MTFKYFDEDGYDYEVTAKWTPPEPPRPCTDRDNPLFHDLGEDGEVHSIEVFAIDKNRWLSNGECSEFLMDNYDRLYEWMIDP
jgi:hypothetical protein